MSKYKIIIIIKKLLVIYSKIFSILLKKNITNENKEKLLKIYSISLFLKSFKVLISILIICIIIYLTSLFDTLFLSHILSLVGILETILTMIFCYLIKKNFNDKL